jgi:ribose transport system permease protein
LLALILMAVQVAFHPDFLGEASLSGFLAVYVPLACVAIGVSFSMLVGGIDLSVGSVVTLVNVLCVALVGAGWDLLSVGPAGKLYVCSTPGACTGGWSFPAAAAVSVAIGTAVGLLNGFVVGYIRVHPLLATLATGFMAGGAALYLLPLPGGQVPQDVVAWYVSGAVLPKPAWALLITLALALLLLRSPLGLRMRAVGSDDRRAFLAGVNNPLANICGYSASAFFASLGGLLVTLNISAGDPAVGNPFTLNAVAAAVLGGTSLAGGWAEPFGPTLGAFLLGLVVSIVLSTGVPSYYQHLVSGLVIVAGLAGSQALRYLRLRVARGETR